MDTCENGRSPALEAQELVYGDRNADYGHPLDDFSKTAALWTARLQSTGRLATGAVLTPEDVAWFMVDVKWSREQNSPKRDNVVDAIGYVLTYWRILRERARRAR